MSSTFIELCEILQDPYNNVFFENLLASLSSFATRFHLECFRSYQEEGEVKYVIRAILVRLMQFYFR
jgi:hypothetical protein